MLGLYNLGRHDIGIELRVVITRMNYRRLPKLPDFIYRNLPFVEFISLMGLEYTGYTIKNREAVWIDPMDYQAELAQAVLELRDWRMDVSIFNLPRCVLPEALWPFARKSISDWKPSISIFVRDVWNVRNVVGCSLRHEHKAEA